MISAKELPRVTLIGRPNVGKSTLFNRLVGKHVAITSEESGTTRDRLERTVSLGRGVNFLLTDVGGIETDLDSSLEDDIQAQIGHAVSRSSLILFLIDVRAELTADDLMAADLLRQQKIPIILIANKWESGEEVDLMNFTQLGIGMPLGLSALHLTGFDELKRIIGRNLRRARKEKRVSLAAPEIVVDANVAIIGRPNVGKSSLVNALLGKQRVIVSEVPCTTRDTNDVILELDNKKFRLLDTAGIRRPGKIGKGIDRFATGRTLNAISDADVALLLLDGKEGVTSQDQHVVEKVLRSKVGLIIVVNKIDTWEEFAEEQDRWLRTLTRRFQFVRYAPVVMVSAKTGKNLNHIFDQVLTIKAEREKRIPTRSLNLFFQKIIGEHPPRRVGTKAQPRIYYVTQAETNPPTFIIFVNRPAAFHFSYRRHIENRLREQYGFFGTPIQIEFRQKTSKDLSKLQRKH